MREELGQADTGATGRRLLVAAAIVVLHLTVAVLVSRPPPTRRTTAPVVAMEVRTIAAPAPQRSPPGAAESPVATSLTPPAFETDPSPSLATPCDLTAALATALPANQTVTAALAAIAARPTHTLMLWNGGWSDQAEVGPLRDAVVQVLGSAPANCLDAPLTGPRLIFLSTDNSVVSVAVGSGMWHWRDLLSSG